MATDRSTTGDILAALRSPLPWIALVVPLVASIAFWQVLWRDAAREAAQQFERRTQSAEAALRTRLWSYEQMLVAGAAHFAVSREVTRAEWAEYAGRVRLADYPGIQALGFAERVRRADREKHVKRMRAEGLAEYDIRPPGERDDYVVIVHSEPFKGRNARVVGLDTYSQPVLRAAIDRAFERNEAAITEKVVLPGEDASGAERTQPGFVMYLPALRAGMPAGTREERDAALLGFVFATFRMNDLTKGLLDRGLAPSVDAVLYDGERAVPEALLAEVREGDKGSAAPVFQRSAPIDVGGRRWTAIFSSRPEFDARAQDAISVGVLMAGLAASLALFVLALLLTAERKRVLDTSMRDALTHLFNRRYLEETMGRELPRAKRAQQSVGVVLLDIDRFKAIEEEFGIDCGERILGQFARLLEKNTRKGDIACRFGGAEFAVALPGANLENSMARAEVLREALASIAVESAGKPIGAVTLSAGVAAYPQNGEDWASVFQRAHRALYAAKAAGRNQVAVAETTGFVS